MSMTENAPAKINVGLRITGRRDDGFHNILSIFQTVTVYDELTAEIGAGEDFTCSDPAVPVDGSNLVVKAYSCFQSMTGIYEDVSFHLEKNIPTGAGLGGGSSDAAAALRMLCGLYDLDQAKINLRMCAEKLGSDVPFLLNGGTAVVRGRGEVVEPVMWPFDFVYVIVYPGFGVSTAWAYGNIHLSEGPPRDYDRVVDALDTGTVDEEQLLDALRNDFETVVFAAYPELSHIRHDLLVNGARASVMSGSGSSIIGIFDNLSEAEKAASIIRCRDRRVFVAKKTG